MEDLNDPYADVRRRIYFMVNEIERAGGTPTNYRLTMSRHLFVAFMNSAPDYVRDEHHQRQAYLLGWRLALSDTNLKNYLAMIHEVRG